MTRGPELRFAGFSEEWEKETLGNLNKFSKGKGYSKNDLSDDGYQIFLYGQMYTDYQMQVNELNTHVKTLKKNSVLSNGNEVLIPSSGETALDLARASHMNISDVILGGDLNILIPCEKILPHFEALTLSTEKNRKNLSTLAQGKSVVHLYGTDIKTDVISYPDINEQEKIGDLFSKIDQLIESQQELVDQTMAFKKSMLQKMFPKKDSLASEFRFDGFKEHWNVKKLGDFLEEYKIKTTIENEYDMLSSTNMGVTDRDRNLGTASNIGYKVLEINDLVLSPQNLWLGNININNFKKGIVSPSYYTFKINNLNLEFFKPQLKTKRMLENYKNASMQGASVVRRNLEINEFYDIKLKVPTLEEQEKIGDFFKKLDEKIAKEEKLLDAYKDMKKSLLQKMFV